jgi:hypothetical protein
MNVPKHGLAPVDLRQTCGNSIRPYGLFSDWNDTIAPNKTQRSDLSDFAECGRKKSRNSHYGFSVSLRLCSR